MTWHDVSDPASRELDELASQFSFHALHVEDCRNAAQRTKVENEGHYLFIVLTLLTLARADHAGADHDRSDQDRSDHDRISQVTPATLSLFVSLDYLVTVHHTPVALLNSLRGPGDQERPDQVLYHVIDGVVESYLPLIEKLEDAIEKLQDEVIDSPRPESLEQIAGTRTTLMQVRRVLSSTRHVVFQLRHFAGPIIGPDMSPFLRDAHDDLAINLETIAGERDRLTGILDIYLSSVANRTTEATRTLTLLGTVALPALVVTSFLGMAIDYPAWVKTPWTFSASIAFTIALTGFLLWYLKRHDDLPGGTTARTPERSSGSRDTNRRYNA